MYGSFDISSLINPVARNRGKKIPRNKQFQIYQYPKRMLGGRFQAYFSSSGSNNPESELNVIV